MKKIMAIVLLSASLLVFGVNLKDSVNVEKTAADETLISTAGNSDPGTGSRP